MVIFRVCSAMPLLSSVNHLSLVGLTDSIACRTLKWHYFTHLLPFIVSLNSLQVPFARSVEDDGATVGGAILPANFVNDGKALSFLLGLAVDTDDEDDPSTGSPPEEDAAPSPLDHRRVFQQQKGHLYFDDDDDDGSKGSDVPLDEEQAKMLDGFDIMAGDDLLGPFGVSDPVGDNQPTTVAEDEETFPGKQFIDTSPDFGEHWDNCLGDTRVNVGCLHRGVIETKKRRQSFIDSWSSGPSSVLRALPFIWNKRKEERTHYFADLYMAVQIVARQLGFRSAVDYVRCRGWCYSKKGGNPILRYRKLEEVFDQYAPDGVSANLAKNFNAMVDVLYEVLSMDEVKDIYTGKSFVLFMKQGSFISKLHNFCQEFHIALIIVTRFFLDHVPDHHGDAEYWIKVIFRPCLRHKDFLQFSANCFELFEEEGGNPTQAKELLERHRDCMRDEVHRLITKKEHMRDYGMIVERELSKIQRGTRDDVMPSAKNNLTFARQRVRDMQVRFMLPAQKDNYESSTYKFKDRYRKASKTRKDAPRECRLYFHVHACTAVSTMSFNHLILLCSPNPCSIFEYSATAEEGKDRPTNTKASTSLYCSHFCRTTIIVKASGTAASSSSRCCRDR